MGLKRRPSRVTLADSANDRNFEVVIKFRIPDPLTWLPDVKKDLYAYIHCIYRERKKKTEREREREREMCNCELYASARGTNSFPMCSPMSSTGAKEQFLFQRLSVKTSHIVRHC